MWSNIEMHGAFMLFHALFGHKTRVTNVTFMSLLFMNSFDMIMQRSVTLEQFVANGTNMLDIFVNGFYMMMET